MKVTREMICAAHDVTLKKGDVILSAGLLEKIYLAMDALANQAKTSSSPVAWNGGKEGSEWTTDKEVAEGWLIEHPMYQAMPLYAEPPEMSDLIKQRDELLVALENCRLFASRHRKEDWASHILRFCESVGVAGSPLRDKVRKP